MACNASDSNPGTSLISRYPFVIRNYYKPFPLGWQIRLPHSIAVAENEKDQIDGDHSTDQPVCRGNRKAVGCFAESESYWNGKKAGQNTQERRPGSPLT